MSSYEFKRNYHPKLGRFVYEHKGSGIIVDNIFKPIKSVLTSAFKKVAKPMAKKALESGISHAGDKLGKKAAEKSGEMIMKKLHGLTTKSFSRFPKESGSRIAKQSTSRSTKIKPKQEDHNLILNRLISGNGFKR